MEAIKLQSMTDFIESKKPIHAYLQNESFSAIQTHINETYDLFFKYCDFLKQPLQLGFFVPCDEEGNVLEEPKRWNDYLEFPDSFDGNKEWGELYNYETAKERVLFKGFEARMFGWKKLYYVKLGDNKNSIYTFPNLRNYTIENLVRLEVELTDSAIKQIGI